MTCSILVRYLANVYSYIPDPLVSNGVNYTPISDEADWVFNWPHQQLNTGNWSPVNTPYDIWSKYYKGIRAASTYIHRVESICLFRSLEHRSNLGKTEYQR